MKLLRMDITNILIPNLNKYGGTMDNTKEVYFNEYCKICKYSKNSETEDPCYDCLHEPVNIDSHKPVYFHEKRK